MRCCVTQGSFITEGTFGMLSITFAGVWRMKIREAAVGEPHGHTQRQLQLGVY